MLTKPPFAALADADDYYSATVVVVLKIVGPRTLHIIHRRVARPCCL